MNYFELKRLSSYIAGVVMDETLVEHDGQFHPDGYKDGDTCSKRETMSKNDESDRVSDVDAYTDVVMKNNRKSWLPRNQTAEQFIGEINKCLDGKESDIDGFMLSSLCQKLGWNSKETERIVKAKTGCSIDDIRDATAKYAQVSGVSPDKYVLAPEEFTSFIGRASNGEFSFARISIGPTITDVEFLEDIERVVGKDHPYVKRMNELIEMQECGTTNKARITNFCDTPNSVGFANPYSAAGDIEIESYHDKEAKQKSIDAIKNLMEKCGIEGDVVPANRRKHSRVIYIVTIKNK